jgi:glycosyltransferase involved in cell wall biosynthesis
MKRISFIYTGSSPTGGLSTYLLNLFKHFPKDNSSLRLISVGHWEQVHDIQNSGGHVDVVRGFLGMVVCILREKPNILITAGVKSTLYGRLASLLTGAKIVTTVHSDFRYDYKDGIKKSIFLLLDRLFRFRTSKYIAVSQYLKNRLEKEGIPSHKITVVYNGVDFLPESHSTGSANKIVIGSVGRLHTTKGFDLLISAMDKLPKHVYLKIWGEGDQRLQLENLIKQKSLNDRVGLMGFTKEISDVYDQIDIYVQPSRMEGFGLALVEAMSQGLPVVATPVGALPEIVTHGVTGLLAKENTSEAIAKEIKVLVDDKQLASQLGTSAAKEVRERFSMDSFVKKLAEAILS